MIGESEDAPAGRIVEFALTPCRRCKRDMFVSPDWASLSPGRKAEAICAACWSTPMFDTSME